MEPLVAVEVQLPATFCFHRLHCKMNGVQYKIDCLTGSSLVSNNASAGIVISNNAGATIGYVFANANLSSSMFDKASIAINSDGTITHTHGVMGALFVKNDTSIVTTNDNSSIAASDLYVQSIFSDWNFNDIWYMTSGSYPMLQVTNKGFVSFCTKH